MPQKFTHKSASGYIELPAPVVKKKIEKILSCKKRKYEKIYQEYLDIAIEDITESCIYWRSSWLGRFIFGKMPSTEEILERAKRQVKYECYGGGDNLRFSGELFDADWEHRVARTNLEGLLTSAILAGEDMILVSSEEAGYFL